MNHIILACLKIITLIMQEICHRDLKLENTLLDGSSSPQLKICDFGYSKARVSQLSNFNIDTLSL